MSKHLQVALQVDTDANKNDGYEINVTPVDLPISDQIANPLALAIGVGDLMDSVPGNGQLDTAQHLKVPIKMNVFITKINTTVETDMVVVLRVVDKA